MHLAEDASLEYTTMQTLGREALYVHHAGTIVERYARLRHFAAELDSSVIKSRFICNLTGPGSETQLGGVYLSSGSQHVDIRTVQRHLAPQARSQAFYKGGVRDKARAVYQGLIEVAPGAAKTDAYLTNRNLLLNDGARANSIPSLQIKTDGVRCSHGWTTGRISNSEVFYLMTRGLERVEAESMLAMGFFEHMLGSVTEPLVTELWRYFSEKPAAERSG